MIESQKPPLNLLDFPVLESATRSSDVPPGKIINKLSIDLQADVISYFSKPVVHSVSFYLISPRSTYLSN